MGTRKVKVRGIAYWARVFEHNRDLTGYEDALKDVGGQTTIDVDLPASEVEKVKRAGCMKTGVKSPDDPEMIRFKFSRKWESPYEGLGGAPTVTDAHGQPWDVEQNGLIGNGSVVDVTLMVYDTKRKGIVGTRLEAVRVVENVKYDPDEGMPDLKARPPKGNTTQEQEEEQPRNTKDLDGDIPF